MDQEVTTAATGSIISLAITLATQHPPTPVVAVVDAVKQFHGSVVVVLPPPDLGTEAMFLRCSDPVNEDVEEWARDLPWW